MHPHLRNAVQGLHKADKGRRERRSALHRATLRLLALHRQMCSAAVVCNIEIAGDASSECVPSLLLPALSNEREELCASCRDTGGGWGADACQKLGHRGNAAAAAGQALGAGPATAFTMTMRCTGPSMSRSRV